MGQGILEAVLEKLVYCLWRDPQTPVPAFSQRLRSGTAETLLKLGARGLQINVADEAVAPAAGLRQINLRPQMEGLLYLWLDTAVKAFRKPFDEAIAAATSRMAGYLVSESMPIRNTLHPPRPGERTEGWSQLAFFTRPDRLTQDAWLDIWQNSHTRVAIDTQSTYLYVQNAVIRPVTYGAPGLSAIVEEGFPAAAMSDRQAFFDAAGDEAKYKRNLQAMMDSCARFIDFERMDVVPSSQYLIKSPAA